ncbi:iron-sulfur cluster repair di-iron protein [Flavobacterium sp.]|uniref:iron-sulfur cluster repair di-iron protein n=1 Tax=Flavobacterium sp. TaxID=239 RepID=UPI0035279CC3
MTINKTTTIGEIVAQNYKTASVFSKLGIDFCCKGNRTISEVCENKNIKEDYLLNLIVNGSTTSENNDYNSWTIDILTDYIEKTHHRYVEEKSAIILTFLNKLTKVHGEKHPELFEINTLFKTSVAELTQHMKKEELLLFPFIKKMIHASSTNTLINKVAFGNIENPINMMKHEHENEGERFEKISTLSNTYTPPADACNTYKVTFQMLNEFQEDLHKHIHLENNILFPKAIQLYQHIF